MKKLISFIKDFLFAALLVGLFFVCASSLFSGLATSLIVIGLVAVIGGVCWWRDRSCNPLQH